MSLLTALNDFKRHRGRGSRFPGERRTTTGLFSGSDGRLVHVDRDGQLRDFSYPLCGLYGIAGSRFGLDLGDGTTWLGDFDLASQSYHGDTTLVESTYRDGDLRVSRYDLTLGRGHVTHVAVSGDVPDDATLWALQRYAPEGQEARVGRLVHDDAVEVFHREERDFLHAATPFATVVDQPALRFEDLVGEGASAFPGHDDVDRREDSALGGNVVVEVELEAGSTTLVSLLTDDGVDRVALLRRARELVDDADGPSALRAAAEARARPPVPGDHPDAGAVRSDLRVLELLSAPSGARIAGPDFDPFYAYSGGYGYTWFRDDAEISRFLLEAERPLDLDLADWHDRSAQFYCGTQRDDGTWPHRVWPDTGALAPGWANGRIEAGDGVEYQADQTASVVAFLARYLRERDPEDPGRVEAAVADGLDGLDATLAADGLPEPCQNAWENATGRFAHTAATFLGATAAAARAPVADDVAERARGMADAVHDGLDGLWSEDREIYGMGLADGDLDDRLDASSFALVGAHAEYAAAADGLDARRRRRLAAHVETALAELYRETDDAAGLVRFEGDEWRQREQGEPKIWTVSTAWGANAAAKLATLREADGAGPEPFASEARDLLALLLPGGSLCGNTGYLPEQVFDDGTPDSATPLGWPHALRLATVAHLTDRDAGVAARRGAGSVDR